MSANRELSDLFATMASIMDLRGENPFKAIAFQKVSRILRELGEDIRQVYEEQRLDQIPGIGEHSQKVIEDYLGTGRSTDYDELAASVPSGLLEMLQIPGLGPKTISLFWKQRKITCLQELTEALDSGKLSGIKGIGDKKLESIRQGIALRQQATQRRGIGEVIPVALTLLEQVRRIPGVHEAQIAGSLRRGRETIGDVDLLCTLEEKQDPREVSAGFAKLPQVQRVLGQGPTKASIVTDSGLQVDLRIVPRESFGAALLYFTGSKEHNVRIRGLALDKGFTLNEWGLYRLDYEKSAKKTGEAPALKCLASRTEAEIYAKLGLPYIEPELREDRGEVEAAQQHRLPRLIEQKDLRGDLHCHTVASDGHLTIEQMAEVAMGLGFEYLAITDHSKSQTIANGLSAERLLKHAAEVRRVNERLKGITLLAGTEVDILADGRLDYEDAVLAELDIVVASPHAALKQPKDKATDRLLRAIENKHVHIIGHPTGRMINAREGLPLDMAKIIKAAAASGTALEINAGYPRLDLDEFNARAAAEGGAMIAINTDAHSDHDFAMLEFGLRVARRAWLTKDNVINCLPAAGLEKFLARKR